MNDADHCYRRPLRRHCTLLALAAASIVAGLALSGRPARKPTLPWMRDLHRHLGGLTVVFLGFHVTSLLLDSYTSWTPLDIVVPFQSSWKPGAVAWGILAMYALVAIEISSLTMRRSSCSTP